MRSSPYLHPVPRVASATAIAALLVVGPALPAPAATTSAFVRVNQLGYSSPTKRAYLMSSGAETGAMFAVKNSSGATVFSGPVGANVGSWSSAYPDVYALDFDAVTAIGTYTISVTG